MQVDALANVLCPASKLWCTGQGATMMREAVSLMGGYGITEDCPGFLGQKWMDAQLEATYEGPEAVQRRQLTFTMTNPVFLAMVRSWIRELDRIKTDHPELGADILSQSFQLWMQTLEFLQQHKDTKGSKTSRACSCKCGISWKAMLVLQDSSSSPNSLSVFIKPNGVSK